MCGFVFIPGYTELSAEHQLWCRKATNKISHRGMTSRIEIFDGDLYYHRRLPIVRLDESGDHLKAGPYMFVGEIFNYASLQPEATRDLDVMVNVFNSTGLDGFHQFDGFWSGVFAGTVFNDYLNQKPVYYRQWPFWAFASEPAALALDGLDEDCLGVVALHGLDPTGRTPYRGVRMMHPGTAWEEGRFRPYWNWEAVQTPDPLDQAIKFAYCGRKLHGDRPSMLLASGGLDSSILACLYDPMLLIHVENDEKEFFHMLPSAGQRIVELDDGAALREEAFLANQSPVDLGSVVPQYALAEAIGVHTNVVITGDGADELFGGYSRNQLFDSQRYDVFTELPYYHCPRLDNIMMSKTIELRTPYLAPQVIKLALQLPYKARSGKAILKEMFGPILPPEIVRRKKVPLRKSGYENTLEQRLGRIELFRRLFKGV